MLSFHDMEPASHPAAGDCPWSLKCCDILSTVETWKNRCIFHNLKTGRSIAYLSGPPG